MLRAYKYRIYPTDEQKVLMEKTFGCCRLVYNLALQTKIEAYDKYGVRLSYFDLSGQLTDLKKEFDFLYDVDANSLLYSIKCVDVAFNNFFNKSARFPRYKTKHSTNSYQSRNLTDQTIDWNNSRISIAKIKNIPIVLSRKFEGRLKHVTISRTHTDKYFASILVEDSVELPEKSTPNNILGIDLGIKDLIITSEGVKYNNPKYLKNQLSRLKILNRRASRKKKGSQNRRKANLKVAIQYEKISNKRLDFIHKVTSELINDNQVDSFAMEDLNVKGMMANHNLAGAIQDASWGKFLDIMKYKCDWSGKNLILINRFAPSSKTCSNCGNIKDNLTLADREYCCNNCGYVNCRDINAAINIKNFGKKLSGTGSPEEPVELSALAGAKKQEGLIER